MSKPVDRPRRPVPLGPGAMDAQPGTASGLSLDPQQRADAAYATALALVGNSRSVGERAWAVGSDFGPGPDTARLLAVIDSDLDEVALLWSTQPPASLPGMLWRLYVLRMALSLNPEYYARAYAAGRDQAQVHDAIAGVAQPWGPTQVRQISTDILTGAFTGDLTVAAARAGAFCLVVATGMATLLEHDPVWVLGLGQVEVEEQLDAKGRTDCVHRDVVTLLHRAADMHRTGGQLYEASRNWSHQQ